MKRNENQYNHDFVTSPGETLNDLLEEKKLSVEWLSQALEMKLTEIQHLLSGEKEITVDLACKLEKAFGASAGFWINREKFYRE